MQIKAFPICRHRTRLNRILCIFTIRATQEPTYNMNISSLIAKRWATSTPLMHTRRILRMGIWSMGLCIAVMVVAICILVGFKQEISRKVYIVRPVSDRYLAAGGNLSYILRPMFRAIFIGQSYERIMRKERCQWDVNDNGIEL